MPNAPGKFEVLDWDGTVRFESYSQDTVKALVENRNDTVAALERGELGEVPP